MRFHRIVQTSVDERDSHTGLSQTDFTGFQLLAFIEFLHRCVLQRLLLLGGQFPLEREDPIERLLVEIELGSLRVKVIRSSPMFKMRIGSDPGQLIFIRFLDQFAY